jgi:hypothetical protein
VDQVRQIRFVIPPFLLFASLLLCAYLNGYHPSPIFKLASVEGVIGALVGGAATTVAIGYLISTVSVLFLRCYACWRDWPTYEAQLGDDAFRRIWVRLDSEQEKDPKLILYAATTFDHELLDKPIHEWLFRRWNSFYVATNSVVALFFALVLSLILPIHGNCKCWAWWALFNVLAGLLLGIAARQSWREVMKMIEFQSFRLLKSDLHATK